MCERGIQHPASHVVVRHHQMGVSAERHGGEACPSQSATALIDTPFDNIVEA
jgi:hypothetical protein